MGRGPLLERITAFLLRAYAGLAPLSRCCPPLQGMFPRGPQPCATHGASAPRVRLACIRHAASVRPEPGSNSSLCGVERLYEEPTAPPRERDGARVHHHDSVVKVQAPHAGLRRTKNQGSARERVRRTPGDVSGHTASAFRKEGRPENRVVASTARAVRRRRVTTQRSIPRRLAVVNSPLGVRFAAASSPADRGHHSQRGLLYHRVPRLSSLFRKWIEKTFQALQMSNDDFYRTEIARSEMTAIFRKVMPRYKAARELSRAKR